MFFTDIVKIFFRRHGKRAESTVYAQRLRSYCVLILCDQISIVHSRFPEIFLPAVIDDKNTGTEIKARAETQAVSLARYLRCCERTWRARTSTRVVSSHGWLSERSLHQMHRFSMLKCKKEQFYLECRQITEIIRRVGRLYNANDYGDNKWEITLPCYFCMIKHRILGFTYILF